ncbi:MAG: 16S rRNA (cytosine(967)-C(5))-methyltransferase RsmB [Solobacterium sp.]|nr:16S rRNA (cytosine(967)-C(5))-methyltransferase RsmB [Solobacterium sp.]
MNAREYALDVLYRVFREHGFASLILRSCPLDEQETALAANMIYGTIRQYALLEAQWRPHVKTRVRPRTALLLDMTVYQLFFMDGVPAYAAVNEAVAMTKKAEKSFVNAVLRSVQEQGLLVPEGDAPAQLAVRFSHPEWLVRMWTAHYGREQAMRILAADQKEHPAYGRINTLRNDPAIKEDSRVTMVEDDCFHYDGVLSRTDWFREGKILIQDRSSQRVARQLDAKAGMRVLDVCAAPGTKTQHTACLMNDTGSITACDLYEQRCGLIDQLMEKTGVSIVHTESRDASQKREESEYFDRILCDVPCSGLGDLSHKPEIRWHIQPQDIDEVARTQAAILDASADALKHGGILVYSTCTLNRKENEKQIAAFLSRRKDYELLHEETLFPDALDADGFYLAKLHRK